MLQVSVGGLLGPVGAALMGHCIWGLVGPRGPFGVVEIDVEGDLVVLWGWGWEWALKLKL